MTQSEFSHLLSSINTLSPEQLERLRRELDGGLAASGAVERHSLTPEQQADQESQRRLFDLGLLSEIKPPVRVATGTERFTPVPIKGEPLSQTVIRERR